MVPCPWFREIAESAAADPVLDLGIHLTLTSEWANYRWAPISTVSRASGLIDDEGYFWRDVASLRAHLVPEAAEAELRAQIERARSAGIIPTHIDAHMAAAMLPELLELHFRLGHAYGLVPVLPRTIRFAPDPESYRAAVAELERAGLPVIDNIRGTLPVAAEAVEPGYRKLIEELPPASRILRCTAPPRGISRRSALSMPHGEPTNMHYSLQAQSPIGAGRWGSCQSAIGRSSLSGQNRGKEIKDERRAALRRLEPAISSAHGATASFWRAHLPVKSR
jgi:YdjC-like protein